MYFTLTLCVSGQGFSQLSLPLFPSSFIWKEVVVPIGKVSRTKGFARVAFLIQKDDAELTCIWNTIPLEIYAHSQKFSLIIFACKK
jgi:hypothetical protein